ncbi:hypothetical protein MTR67_022832 [Solanum verrucosum]|uniref:Uncharacterized protein n=1 Tax=Solanum verrucosum TaxID=315347 RepID=A0AAF0QVL3_SOLVR|nr:hypothetical protein MTR67_022832 [Solanum verrucosum]
MGINETHLTTSESDREDNLGPRSPAFASEPEDDQTLQQRRVELLSKVLHDLARLPVTPPPPPPPAHTTEQAQPVPPVQALPPHSMNRLEAARLRTILEEKRLSTNGVVGRYPDVPKGNKKAKSFTPVNYVVVRGKRVKCGSSYINEKMQLRAKQSQTSLPFSVLFMELCWRARVPFVAKTDMEVTFTSFTNIWRIEAKYTRDEAERRKAVPVDTSPAVDVDMLEGDTYLPTHANEPSALDALTVRVEACEQGGRQSADVTALRAVVAGLRGDVDELNPQICLCCSTLLIFSKF